MNFFLIMLLSLVPSYPTISTAPISQEFGNLGHTGIDFKIPTGTPLYADIDGTIIKEDKNSYYGDYIMIKHPDGYTSLYAHLSEYKVKVGDKVKSGDLIGLSGDWISGAHLHWEVRPKGHTYSNLYNINPMVYLMSFLKTKYRSATVNSYSGVNIRAGPSLTTSVLYTLGYDEPLQIVEEKNGWARLNYVRPEWVMLRWIHYTPGLCTKRKQINDRQTYYR